MQENSILVKFPKIDYIYIVFGTMRSSKISLENSIEIEQQVNNCIFGPNICSWPIVISVWKNEWLIYNLFGAFDHQFLLLRILSRIMQILIMLDTLY